jgi:hypothetical protein
MKLTRIGSDYIRIDEENINDELLKSIPRVHLILLAFEDPTEAKVKQVIRNFPRTNRFVIEDNIRIYNLILRNTNKKYYVSNSEGSNIISFFRKNNKVLVNFNKLDEFEKAFLLLENVFQDVLKNTEVVQISKEVFDEKFEVLENWRGNVIISGDYN